MPSSSDESENFSEADLKVSDDFCFYTLKPLRGSILTSSGGFTLVCLSTLSSESKLLKLTAELEEELFFFIICGFLSGDSFGFSF